MQQSAAFKVLRTRLKTVPSYSFKEERFRRTSGIPYSQFNYGGGGSQISEDGDLNENLHDMHSGINFDLKLQQLQQIQKQHHLHSKSQTQSRFVSTSWMKVFLCFLCPLLRWCFCLLILRIILNLHIKLYASLFKGELNFLTWLILLKLSEG